jgi:hypothetical protein
MLTLPGLVTVCTGKLLALMVGSSLRQPNTDNYGQTVYNAIDDWLQ